MGFRGPETTRPKSPGAPNWSLQRPKPRGRQSPPIGGLSAVAGKSPAFVGLRGGAGRNSNLQPDRYERGAYPGRSRARRLRRTPSEAPPKFCQPARGPPKGIGHRRGSVISAHRRRVLRRSAERYRASTRSRSCRAHLRAPWTWPRRPYHIGRVRRVFKCQQQRISMFPTREKHNGSVEFLSRYQSSWMLAVRITSAHLADSLRMWSAISWGELCNSSAPASISFWRTTGSATAAK